MTIAMEKPISRRPKLCAIAIVICPLMIPIKSVFMTCDRLGNIKSGTLEYLDVTSHITAMVAINRIRLKAVVIPHFLL